MTGDDKWSEAHDLFVAYDGSTFYMSRDGVDDAYRAFEVPKEVEALWLSELTTEKLSQLDEPDNYRVLTFLWLHQDPAHLSEVVGAEPLGRLAQRRAFVQGLFQYVKLCQDAGELPRHVREALNRVIVEGEKLLTETPPGNAEEVVHAARQRLAALGASSS